MSRQISVRGADIDGEKRHGFVQRHQRALAARWPFVDMLREVIFLRFLWKFFLRIPSWDAKVPIKKQIGKFQGAVLQILPRNVLSGS